MKLQKYTLFEKTKARLLFTNDCNRSCKGCCNKNWTGDPADLITIQELEEFDEIYITGGEPMLYPEKLKDTIQKLKNESNSKIFLYTAKPFPKEDFLEIMDMIDGCTLTIHNWKDRDNFREAGYDMMEFPNKDMRLNIFVRGQFPVSDSWDFRPKKWIKDAPLPTGETFVRLETKVKNFHYFLNEKTIIKNEN